MSGTTDTVLYMSIVLLRYFDASLMFRIFGTRLIALQYYEKFFFRGYFRMHSFFNKAVQCNGMGNFEFVFAYGWVIDKHDRVTSLVISSGICATELQECVFVSG